LRLMQVVIVCFTAVVLVYSMNTDATIFKMVENAYKITLVAAFVPLAAGVYWKSANSTGGMVSMFAGLFVWLGMEAFGKDLAMPPQLAGLIAGIIGMVVGSKWPQARPVPRRAHH
nr:sodium:solute symporter [Burkholderiaceae bacterium]